MKQPIWKPFFRLLHQARLPYFYILLYTLLSISASQLYLLFPSYTQKIMQGNINQTMALMVAAVVLGQAFVTSVNQFVLAAASAKVTLRFREMIWGKILRLPVPFFDGQPSGNLISRITQDTSKLSDLTATLPGNVLSSLYMFFGAFGILFSYHWKLAALEAVMIPFLYGLGVWQGRIQFSWNQKIQEKIAGLTGHLSEILSSPALVKGFCAEEWETKRGSGWISQLFQADFFRSLINTLLLQLKNLASLIHTVAMIGLGLWMISRKEITIDVWVAFYLYSQNLLNSFSRIMSIWTTVKSAQGAVRRITELMEEATETSGSPADSGFVQGDISFRDVTFSYGEKPVLEHLTFTAAEGKMTALIGSSGAGKTTVFQLLERFYTPDRGMIRIGGRDISSFPLEEWRRMIGYAPQAPFLFSGTIRENILYGVHRPVTDQELCRAIQDSCCEEFISAMPHGLMTRLGENGSGLSGGQRQRLSLARLFLQNPRILLLDEVTANLDPESEYMVELALARLRKGRTTLVIAHRRSAVKDADQIIVLKGQESGPSVPERSLL